MRNPVDFPTEVNRARTIHIPEDIPNPSNENGLLFILLIIISATIYPAIQLPPIIYWFTNMLNPALLRFNEVE